MLVSNLKVYVTQDKNIFFPLKIQLIFCSELLLMWPYDPPDQLNSHLVSLGMCEYDWACQTTLNQQ